MVIFYTFLDIDYLSTLRLRRVRFFMKNMNFKSYGSVSLVTKTELGFQINVSIDKKIITNQSEYYFFLKQRNGKKKIFLSSSVHLTSDKHVIFQVIVNPPDSLLLKTEKQIWDLYLFTKDEHSECTYRIKTSKDGFPFVTILTDNQTKMFYPYQTTHGNASFVFSYLNVRAAITNIDITKQHLHLQGLFHFPLPAPITARLIIANTQNDEITKIPLENIKQDERDSTIFHFACDAHLYDQCVKNMKIVCRFYLEMDAIINGQKQTFRSERLHWLNPKKKIQKRIRGNGSTFHGKIKVIAQPTKKAKYLHFSMSAYTFKKRFIEETKETLIKIRRSKWVLQLYKQLFAFIGWLPKRNIIFFESFHGKQFSCSPRAIYEYLKENNYPFQMYWSIDKKYAEQFKDFDIQTVPRFTLKWLFLMPQAKYWITNSRLPVWLPKPRKTLYVQTWHGTPLKKLAADMEEVHMPATNADKYIANFLKEAKKWDMLISPNAYSTEIFRRAFQFEKEIIESGYPRNDFLINHNRKEMIEQIKEKLSLPKDKKVILYAPTWRDNHYYEKGKYKFDIPLDTKRLKQELKEQYIMLFRLHYLVAEQLNISENETFMFNCSSHEDIRELYLISDILITDYSSVFFDFANLRRPIIFYVYDLEEYRDKLRGFYFDFETYAPGPLVKTTDELIAEIKKLESEPFQPTKHIKSFYEKFCSLEDGMATKRVVDKIFQR